MKRSRIRRLVRLSFFIFLVVFSSCLSFEEDLNEEIGPNRIIEEWNENTESQQETSDSWLVFPVGVDIDSVIRVLREDSVVVRLHTDCQ